MQEVIDKLLSKRSGRRDNMTLLECYTIRTMSLWAIVFTYCLYSEVSSVPTTTPRSFPFEVQHAQAIRKLNLTKHQPNK